MSNNFRPKFTDEECISIYLFGIAEGKLDVKAIYRFICDYWADWFPHLPRYQNFNRRINYLAPAFQTLYCLLLSDDDDGVCNIDHLLDSMPIVVANQSRSNSANTANELCDKGYCSSKKMYYYGVKLHALGQKQHKTLPKMRKVCITPASENDITVAKEWLMGVRNIDIYADKMYADKGWKQQLCEFNIRIFTPIKLAKGQGVLGAADVLFSRAVSEVRQALESFFNWIQQKTHIQAASKVRSNSGLISFIFARLAALAFLYS